MRDSVHISFQYPPCVGTAENKGINKEKNTEDMYKVNLNVVRKIFIMYSSSSIYATDSRRLLALT